MALSKVFIIAGGTAALRQEKRSQLVRDDVFLMHSTQTSEDGSKLAVIFGESSADFNGVNFETALPLAGAPLPANFRTSTIGDEIRFGTINLD